MFNVLCAPVYTSWWRSCLFQAWCRLLTREARNWTSGTRQVSAKRTGASSRWAASASATMCSSAYPDGARRWHSSTLVMCPLSYFRSFDPTTTTPAVAIAINSYECNTYMTIPLTRERCTSHSHSASHRSLASWSRGNNIHLIAM